MNLKQTLTIPRSEYPRPNFMREDYINLNGDWMFEFDDEDKGINEKWFINPKLSQSIIVPFTFQSELSGLNIKEFHDIVWYAKTFVMPKELKDKQLILHFGAVDYKADIWINGYHVMMHEGGHVPFSVNISSYCEEGDTLIVVRAQDGAKDLELPRGKQYWMEKSEGIFYTGTTGIWQTVWLEYVEKTHLDQVMMTPDLDKKKICVEYEINGCKEDVMLGVKISLRGIELIDDIIRIKNRRGKRDFWLDQEVTLDWDHTQSWAWAPDHPVLFDIQFTLFNDEKQLDQVNSYFALRKVEVVDGVFMLNNRPFYQKLLLDQGYWESSLLTAPTDEAFITDIKLSKEMGFNGGRKHQKIEDPRYLYWADQLGFLVWGEMANAYNYSRKYVNKITKEWMEMIKRDYNHPCIVAWTPLNESWGAEGIMNNKDEQAHATAMYWLTKSLDQTRLVISNDGWEHTKTDLLTIHDYEFRSSILKARYETVNSIINSRPAAKGLFAKGYNYEGQPIIVSEMGGISYQKSNQKGWGYSNATSDEDFIHRYYDVIHPLLESPIVQGFCYTQITDVEQEINGLLTYARQPKVDLSIIKAINEGTWRPNK